MKRIEDMIAEAAAQVYGEEWNKMTGEQQKNIIMGFIAQASMKGGENSGH